LDQIPCFSDADFYTKNYDRISNDHLEHFEKTGRNPFMDEDHWREIEDSTSALIEKICHPGIRILDVGVGMGRLLDRFPLLDRYGMDISLGYLKHAQAKGIDVCMSRIEDMPYRPGYFDAVVCTDVLEHVLDLNFAFSKILSVLKPGGILICRVPYREDLGCYVEPSFPYEFVHLRNFDEHFIRLLVEKVFNRKLLEWNVAGFKDGRPKIVIPVPKVNGLIRRLLRTMKVFGDSRHDVICRMFNGPAEINFVILNSSMRKS